MRLVRSLLRLYHAQRALSLQRRSDWHAARAVGLSTLASPRSRAPSERGKPRSPAASGRCNLLPAMAPMFAADLFLLASIVGVGIAGVWIGIVWRAR